MLLYYRIKQGVACSEAHMNQFESISEDEARNGDGPLFFLVSLEPATNMVSQLVHRSSHLIDKSWEPLIWFTDSDSTMTDAAIPPWVIQRISEGKVFMVNVNHPRWEERLGMNFTRGSRIHIAGLGDVGGTLLMGLRALGGPCVREIGIFDLDNKKMDRWVYEANQIYSPNVDSFPIVKPIGQNDLFHCDIFIFSVAKATPSLDQTNKDVRMAQYHENGEIIRRYANMARGREFKGLFAVVSDPVDQLALLAYQESNLNENGEFDYAGLFPEQVKGYGLGVMNARARYYAGRASGNKSNVDELRVFGPHGKGLVVANSIENYSHSESIWLTEKTLNANLDVRATGFKPYVAPAFSSACYPILDTIQGNWHYSTVYLDGVYFGCRNRSHPFGSQWETAGLPLPLKKSLHETYQYLIGFSKMPYRIT